MTSLLERYLPVYQFAERHERTILAAPGRTLDIAANIEIARDPVARGLLDLRYLAKRLARPPAPNADPDTGAFSFRDFVPLGRMGDAEIAFGLAGRFWRHDGGAIAVAGAEEFAAFDSPGVARLVWSFQAREVAQGTQLVTATRVYCPDCESLLKFTPYWFAIRPFSGLIRRRVLAMVARQAAGSPSVG